MISDVKVWPSKNSSSKVKANGSFVVNESFKVKYTLFSGPKGLFVGLPGKYGEKDGKKEWYADVLIINPEVQKQVNQAVIAAYNQKTGNKSYMNQGIAAGPVAQDDEDELPF